MISDGRSKDPGKVNRMVAVSACLMAVLICIAYGHWRYALPHWWKENGGGVPYVVFWITFGFVLFPNGRHIGTIAWVATVGTCLLEFLQLWKAPWLSAIRSTKLGAALLGNDFSWLDIPPYVVGGIAGYLILRSLSRFGSNQGIR